MLVYAGVFSSFRDKRVQIAGVLLVSLLMLYLGMTSAVQPRQNLRTSRIQRDSHQARRGETGVRFHMPWTCRWNAGCIFRKATLCKMSADLHGAQKWAEPLIYFIFIFFLGGGIRHNEMRSAICDMEASLAVSIETLGGDGQDSILQEHLAASFVGPLDSMWIGHDQPHLQPGMFQQ